ncbi:MAG: hypothetical protein GY926_14910, partial [bacterium]|nr:hypothetical protein [bacterium]
DTIIPDPSSGQDFNRYAYVRNNPTSYNDPAGHCPVGGYNYLDCTPYVDVGSDEYYVQQQNELCAIGGGGDCDAFTEDVRGPEFVSPDTLVERILNGETPIGSVGLCGEFEASVGIGGGVSGQGQGCLMRTVDGGDIYFVAGAGASFWAAGVSQAATGGVILSSGGGPGFWPDAGVSGCLDGTAGVGVGGGITFCGGLISTNGVDLGDWAIEIFGGQVTGASASATPQAWVSVNLPDWGPGPLISVEEARAVLATVAG